MHQEKESFQAWYSKSAGMKMRQTSKNGPDRSCSSKTAPRRGSQSLSNDNSERDHGLEDAANVRVLGGQPSENFTGMKGLRGAGKHPPQKSTGKKPKGMKQSPANPNHTAGRGDASHVNDDHVEPESTEGPTALEDGDLRTREAGKGTSSAKLNTGLKGTPL
jgi:hypothetical protein